MDVVLVFKSGFKLDPSTQEGERLLFHLRDFTDTHQTNSGIPVELDEFFAEDTLVDKLASTDPDPNIAAEKFLASSI